MANINAESAEIELSPSDSKIAENESTSNVNGGSSDVKSSVEQSEEQVSTQATDDTVKYDASTLHPESSQSDSTLECEPMDAETSNDEPSSEKENVKKSPAERLKNIYNLEFNAEGGLCDSTDKSKRFDFNYHDNRYDNQDRYDKIGNIVTEIIYEKMEKERDLVRVHIGEDKPGKKRSFFFASKAMLDEKQRKNEKLLIIIHGSGAVRAGQWARSIIINDERGLKTGTQLPYIEKAQEQEQGFSVIVTNTNENYDRSDGKGRFSEPYEHSGSPEEHAEYVWEKYARHADRIAIVAHSYGGVVVARLAEKFHKDFDEKVFAIALTDSVHGGSMGTHAKRIFASRAQNWVTSNEELDTPMESWSLCGWGSSKKHEDATRVSAGHIRHEWTSHACIDSVFKYFTKKLDLFNPNSASATISRKRDHSISDKEYDNDDDNSDNNMDNEAHCLASSSALAAADDPSEPRSVAAETCAGSSNTNRASHELREAGDGAADVPAESNEPCSGDPERRRTDGEGEGQPSD